MPPLPLAPSAAALSFASGIAQVDGCTRALSDNTELSEMLRCVNLNGVAYGKKSSKYKTNRARLFLCEMDWSD